MSAYWYSLVVREVPGVDASWLLRRARRKAGRTQSEVAEAVGLPQSVLSRIEGGHQDPAFGLTQLLLAASDHRLSIRLEDHTGDRDQDRFAERCSSAIHDLRVAELVPPDLNGPYAGMFDDDPLEGPALPEASYWLGVVRDLASDTSEPVHWLQDSYDHRRIDDEQDRALTHRALTASSGAWAAVTAISNAIVVAEEQARLDRFRAPTRRARLTRTPDPLPDPATQRAGARSWAQAVFCLRAQAVLCAQTASYCEAAAVAAWDHRHALAALHRARTGLIDGIADEAELQRVVEAERSLAERRDKLAKGGGTPTTDQIGAAGERLLTVFYDDASLRALAVANQLAEHSALDPWRHLLGSIDHRALTAPAPRWAY